METLYQKFIKKLNPNLYQPSIFKISMVSEVRVLDEKQKQELEELTNMLGAIRGRHTELITVMIPAGFNLSIITRQLETEKSMAANIKSKQTKTAVLDSLERIIRELKSFKHSPKNGLAIFCGNVSEKEGVQDIKLWIYEPPFPLNTRLYRCDQVFYIDPIKELLEVQEVYGLLAIDRQEATIGVLEGKQIRVIQRLSSGVPGKVRAGGQCLSPDTIIETPNKKITLKDIKIGDKIKALDIKNKKIIYTKCLNKWVKDKSSYLEFEYDDKKIISSTEHIFFIKEKNSIKEKAAETLVKGENLINTELKKSIISNIFRINEEIELIDIETEEKNFFANSILVHNSSQRFHRITEGLAKEFFRRVANDMKKAFFDMPKLKGILIGGPVPTKEEFLEQGELVTKLKEKVIALKDIGYTDEHGLELLVEESEKDIAEQELIKEKKILEKFFETLGKHREKAAYGVEKVKAALERGAVELLLISKRFPKEEAKEFEALAANTGASVVIVSTEGHDGEQFYNITKGIGAILRFQIE